MRFHRELLPPAVYLSSSYYEIWTRSLEDALVRAGLIGRDELTEDAPATTDPGRPGGRPLGGDGTPPDDGVTDDPPHRPSPLASRSGTTSAPCAPILAATPATPATRPASSRPSTAPTSTPTATRPRSGDRSHQRPEWLYTVAFAAGELWGDDADPSARVSIDAWEPYLEPAP